MGKRSKRDKSNAQGQEGPTLEVRFNPRAEIERLETELLNEQRKSREDRSQLAAKRSEAWHLRVANEHLAKVVRRLQKAAVARELADERD